MGSIKGIDLNLNFSFEHETFTEQEWSQETTTSDKFSIAPQETIIAYQKIWVFRSRVWLYKDEFNHMRPASSLEEINHWSQEIFAIRNPALNLLSTFPSRANMKFEGDIVGLSTLEVQENNYWTATQPLTYPEQILPFDHREQLLTGYGAGNQRPQYIVP